MKKNSLTALRLTLIIIPISILSWTSAEKEVSNSSAKTTIKTTFTETNSIQRFNNYVNDIYTTANLANSNLDFEVFKKAVVGHFNLKNLNKISSAKEIITIVDFNQPSRKKRLWIVDLSKKALLFNTFVAHGKGSGNDRATTFSNIAQSNQSSLGFYSTGEIYYGKHGRSLRLDGMDVGFNTNARARAIVIHGAEYVSQSFVNQHNRLGRSQGCPALPVELTNAIIDVIKNKTCLFIHGPNPSYTSSYLDQQIAANYIAEDAALAPTAAYL